MTESRRRRRSRALVEQDLHAALLLFGWKARRVLRIVDGHGEAALHRRPRRQLLEPALHIAELVEVDALLLPAHRPGIGADVGDGVILAGEIAPVVEPIVHHAVETMDLVVEPALGI